MDRIEQNWLPPGRLPLEHHRGRPGEGTDGAAFRWRSGFRDAAKVRQADSAVGPGGPLLSIVLPVLNEEDSLPLLVVRVEAVMCDAVGDEAYELVFVDDGSQDGSWRAIASFLRVHPHWQGVRLTRRFGHQAALLAGLSAARGAAVVTMDSDGQHPPALLPRMIEVWRGGAKVVQAVPTLRLRPICLTYLAEPRRPLPRAPRASGRGAAFEPL